jgi:hypothetical protein
MRSVALLLGLAAVSCVSKPNNLFLGEPVNTPISVHLHVSAAAGETDELGGTAALVESVTHELEERRIQHRLYTSDDDHPPTPLIEIWVEKWDPGNRGARAGVAAAGGIVSPFAGLVGFGALSGNFLVVSRLFRGGDRDPVAVLGYAGSIGSASETGSMNKGESVGSIIVDDAFARHADLRTGHCLLERCG